MLQVIGEGRIPFLLRFPKLWQIALNQGDARAQRILMNEVLTEDCIFQPTIKLTLTGKARVVEYMVTVLRSLPDFYMKFSSLKHNKNRIITFKQSCYGSIVPNIIESTPNPFRFIFDYLPTTDLDEHMKLQKQKYDLLKSQNKVISIVRKTFITLRLNSELQYIEAIMAHGIVFEISESHIKI